MTNADLFRKIFGIYATELWAKPELDFCQWLNSEANDGWIPCEAALPLDDDAVLVTYNNGCVGKAWYNGKSWQNINGLLKSVTAWMELPESFHQIKSKEEIQKICIGEVFTLREFEKEIDNGGITSYDGIGYFHDGISDKDTNISVWDNKISYEQAHQYPYVCWYNK